MVLSIKLLFFFNIVALLSIAVLFVYLARIDIESKACKTDCGVANIAANESVQSNSIKETPMKTFFVGITDEGFSNQGIQANGGQTMKLTITNNGKKEHSFKINELKIDSGTIAPGQTKELSIDKLPNETLNYIFYSASSGDSKDIFSGIIMVLKQESGAND